MGSITMGIVALDKRCEEMRWPPEMAQSETDTPRRLDPHAEGRLKTAKWDLESMQVDTRPLFLRPSYRRREESASHEGIRSPHFDDHQHGGASRAAPLSA